MEGVIWKRFCFCVCLFTY